MLNAIKDVINKSFGDFSDIDEDIIKGKSKNSNF